MIKPELYNKTVDILFDAYFKDTLKHGHACGCAVGNLVAANGNFQLETNWKWARVFLTTSDGYSRMYEFEYKGEAARQIDATGYHYKDLAKIERAFEMADRGSSVEDWMFNGLVAVLDVLKEIHRVDDNTVDVNRFKDHYTKRQAITL